MKHATPVPCAANCGRNLRRKADSKSGLCWHCYLERRKNFGTTAEPQTFHAPADAFEAHGDSATLTKTTSEQVRTLEQLIRVCEIDTQEWEVERYLCNKWENVAKDSLVVQLFQVKVWLKRKVNIVAARSEIRDLIEDAKKLIPARPWPKRKSGGRHVLELAVPDLHLGKLAWSPETGYANYDAKIAEKVFNDAIEALVARTAHLGDFERVLLPIGNDLLHVDNPNNTTTAGTQVDVDSRFKKTFVACRRMMIRTIIRLREIAPVDVYVVPGNHDSMATWHLGDSLECFFHETDDIFINNEPTFRKYFHYGSNLIMLTHGNEGKRADYPLVMAVEQPELFGSTKYREVHTGHYHKTHLEEYHGVRVRIIPALCPPDAFHAEKMFVGALRGAEAYVWEKNEGLVAQAYYTV